MLIANSFDNKSLFDKFESFFTTMIFIKAFALILLFSTNVFGIKYCRYDRQCEHTEECIYGCSKIEIQQCFGFCKARPIPSTPPPGPPPSHPPYCETRESCEWWLGEECINGHCGLGRILH